MNASNYKVLYHCEKGTLYRNENNYFWEDKEGNVYCQYNIEDLDKSFGMQIEELKILDAFECSMQVIEEIKIIKAKDIMLMEDLDTREWEEVDCIKIPTGSILYIGKHNKNLIIFADTKGRGTKLIDIINCMFRKGCSIGHLYKFIDWEHGERQVVKIIAKGYTQGFFDSIGIMWAQELQYLQWVEGCANWQGKPINEKQKIKLKIAGSLNKDPFKDYIAFKLIGYKDIDIAFYLNDESGCINKLAVSIDECWCDDKHKFY